MFGYKTLAAMTFDGRFVDRGSQNSALRSPKSFRLVTLLKHRRLWLFVCSRWLDVAMRRAGSSGSEQRRPLVLFDGGRLLESRRHWEDMCLLQGGHGEERPSADLPEQLALGGLQIYA